MDIMIKQWHLNLVQILNYESSRVIVEDKSGPDKCGDEECHSLQRWSC